MKRLVLIIGILVLATYAQAADVQINSILKAKRNASFNNLSSAGQYTTAPDGQHAVQPYNTTACPPASAWIGGLCTLPSGLYKSNGTSWDLVGSGGNSLVSTPTYSDETCTTGTYALASGYIYFCRTTNTWDRIAFAAWSNPSPSAQWYYDGPGTDSFTVEATTNNAACNGGIITGVTGKSISKLAYKQGTLNAATQVKIAVYDTASPGNLLGSGTNSSLSTTAWNEVSITPFTAAGNIKVCVAWNGNSYAYKNASYNGLWATTTYSSYPPSTLTLSTDTNNAWGVRAWAQ